MQKLEQRTIRHHLLLAQRRLEQLALTYGKHTPQYRSMLVKIRRLWALLQMTRSRNEFLTALVPTQ